MTPTPQAKRLSEERLADVIAYVDAQLRNWASSNPNEKWCVICGANSPADEPHLVDCEWALLQEHIATAAAREEQVRELVRIVKASQWPTEDPDTHEVGIWLDRNGTKALDDLLAALTTGESNAR